MSCVRSALVIGGGIAGPVTAAALRKAGIQATVYEAYPGPSKGIGGALALAPNGLNALRIVGADDAVRAASIPITRSVMSVGASRIALPMLRDLPPLSVIERGDLHRILREAAAAAGVRFEWGKRLADVQEGAEGVTASFADGTAATADVLIGSDGVRSTVRSLIDPDAPKAGFTELLGLEGRADADLGLEPGTMTFAYGARAYYIYWPLPEGGVWWGANLPSTRYLSLAEARETPAEEWLRILRDTYAGDVPGELLARTTAAEDLQVTGALHIMPPVPQWFRGRMVLVGDAVHAPSNSSGQGASLAIESGIQLARCLRDAPDPGAAFAAYETLRRARVEKIARRGAALNRTKAPGRVARHVMPLMMSVAFRLMPLERMLGPEQRYTIDWDAPAANFSASAATTGAR
ncbi:MAG: FAD-dependent monooxygenase [Candidatus Dormibacteraeota bacterium]|nr:FAD-dependent monooxygenase [Candidatus Dormibacteraeota bacterium]